MILMAYCSVTRYYKDSLILQRKLPESQLAQSMIESANLLGTDSIMG